MNFPNLQQFDHFTLDTEGTGLDWWLPSVKTYGFSISTPDGQDYYYDIRENPRSVDYLRDQLKIYQGLVIGHYFKFDVHCFRKLGIDLLNNNIDCTMVRACLIDEHRYEYGLDVLARDCLKQRKDDPYEELAAIFGGAATRKDQILNLQHPEARQIVDRYAKKDTRITLDLWEWQKKEIERQDLHQIIALERDVMYPLIAMEHQGVRVDKDRAEQSLYDLEKYVDDLQDKLDKEAGFHINPNPNQTSIPKLFGVKKGEDKKWCTNDGTLLIETEGGKPSIGADALRLMKHPCAALILELRELKKCGGTFIQKHILDREYEGRVYPNINQTKGDDGGTIYGRLSYTQPALQQIPSRNKKISSLTRVLFIPEDGQQWYKMDYSQADARGFVHYTQSPPLVAAYQKDKFTDFHSLTASITGLPRNAPYSGGANAKQMGLGLLFSMGEGTMAEKMGLPYEINQKLNSKGEVIMEWKTPGPEALEIFTNFHTKVPGVKEFSKKATSVAKTRGYIKSIMGRHLRFPGGKYTYKAAGYLYGSATAEFNKVKMVETYNLLKGTGSYLLLSVHDELNFSSGDRDLMMAVKNEMEDYSSKKARIKLSVPMVVDAKSGPNWYETKEEL